MRSRTTSSVCGFETKSVVPDMYGIYGYFLSPENTQLITLFRNIGITRFAWVEEQMTARAAVSIALRPFRG